VEKVELKGDRKVSTGETELEASHPASHPRTSGDLSRRELLVSFLGVAAAEAACLRSRRTREAVPGAIVDRAFETGHLLRQGPLELASDGQKVDVLVVGGGASGLSAGWRLAGAGFEDFLVCELDDDLGGTARSGKNPVTSFPWGAHYIPAPLRSQGPVPRLLGEMGVLEGADGAGRPRYAEQVLVAEPEERVFYKGSWYEGLYLRVGATPQDLAELARFEKAMEELAAARDGRGRKAFDVPSARCSDDSEWTALDRISIAEWLDRERYRSPRLRWLVEYACRDDHGCTADQLSAWAAVWYFAARQEGDGRRNEGYLSWPEGNGKLIQQMAKAVGSHRIAKSCLVHTIEPRADRCIVHAFDAIAGAPRRFTARQVIFAGPRFVAGRVIAPWRESPPAFLSEFQYGPWVVANLTLRQPPRSRGFPLAWDNVLYESRSLGYVVATHQSAKALPDGPTVWTWYYPLTGADVRAERARALSATYSDWEELVMSDLIPAHQGLAAVAERLEVMRFGHAMIRPRPGFIWGKARRDAQQSLGRNLHFAHTDLGGMALFEEANWFGVRAAERALAELGYLSPSWLA